MSQATFSCHRILYQPYIKKLYVRVEPQNLLLLLIFTDFYRICDNTPHMLRNSQPLQHFLPLMN